MAQKKFRLSAKVSSDNLSAIKPALEGLSKIKEPLEKQTKDLKLRPSLKEKARRLSTGYFCPNCAAWRSGHGYGRNGPRVIPLRSSSIMFQKELTRSRENEDMGRQA